MDPIFGDRGELYLGIFRREKYNKLSNMIDRLDEKFGNGLMAI